jgi:hypothetical protein
MMLLLTIASLVSWTEDRSDRLPGSDISVAKAQALYIIEAKILHLGKRRADPRPTGELEYPQVAIEPSKVIKGMARGTVLAKRKVSLLLTVNETVPREGAVYILYIRDENRSSYVFKVTRRDGAIPVRLPGSDIRLSEAENEALYVVEAKILQRGELRLDPSRPRGLDYPRVVIEPSKVIKGMDRGAPLAFREVRLPLREDEADLEEGKVYTLYMREAAGGFEVFRVSQPFEDRPGRLPGSDLSVAEAESEALYVVDARILHLGELREDRGRHGGLVYPQVAIELSKVIQERHEGIARSNRDVRLFLTEDEMIPHEGATYTLYIRGKNRGFEVFKVTRRSEEKPR